MCYCLWIVAVVCLCNGLFTHLQNVEREKFYIFMIRSCLFITWLTITWIGHSAVSHQPEFLLPGGMGATTNNNAVITVTCFTKFSCLYCTGVSWNNLIPNKKFNTEVELCCWVCCLLFVVCSVSGFCSVFNIQAPIYCVTDTWFVWWFLKCFFKMWPNPLIVFN